MPAIHLFVILLVVAQHVSGRLVPATTAHRQLLQEDSVAPTPGEYTFYLKPDRPSTVHGCAAAAGAYPVGHHRFLAMPAYVL
jgi:hypothetical protein